MLVIWIAIEQEKDKDHEGLKKQMLEAVDSLTEEDKEQYDEYYSYLGTETPEINVVKTTFKEVIEETFKTFDYRDVTYGHHRGDVLYITGGLSWGDSPTESYSTFEKFVTLPPKILKLLGSPAYN